MWIVLLWKSSGFPQPYMHETELTTITSLRPLSSDAVVERRSFSISLFIETPYRNDRLLALLLATLRNTTRLTIARGINTPEQLICTRTIAEWKATPPPIGKVPTVFAIGSLS